jgi:hypothetical protein
MKKSRIFMGAGAFVLAIAGFLATKANKKFAVVTTAKTDAIFAGIAKGLDVIAPAGHFTNTFVLNSNSTAYLAVITVNNGVVARVTLVTTSQPTPDKVYYY